MQEKYRRYLLIAAGIAIAAAIAIVTLRPAPQLVETGTVSKGVMEVVVREEGRTEIHERYVVSAPVTGYMPRLNFHVGDELRNGELIVNLQPSRSAALDPRSRAQAEAEAERAAAALQAAHTNAEAARARADFAEQEHQRLKELFETGTVSRQVLDNAEYQLRDARAHLRSAEFTIDVAQHELDAARTRLEYSGSTPDSELADTIAVRAPTGGVILEVERESEGVVNAGEAIVAIGDPETLEAQIDVLSADAVQIEAGMPVRLVRWGGDAPLDGRVRLIEPVGFTKISALGVEEQRVRVRVELISPRDVWQRLGDGYRVEAEFLLWQADSVLRVPAGALFKQENRWMAFVIRDGRAYAQPVEIGHRGEQWAEVISGLAEGDKVVLYPDASLREAVRVKERNSL